MKKNYQMVTVQDYVNMLDSEVKYVDTDALEIKNRVEKYLLKVRKANTNAKLLETLLA